MLCYAMMSCHVMWCYVSSVMWCDVMIGAVMWSNVVCDGVVIWYNMVWYDIWCDIFDVMWCNTMRCDVVLCVMAWHGMAWHGMAWHGMVWYGMVIWYDNIRDMIWGIVWYIWSDMVCDMVYDMWCEIPFSWRASHHFSKLMNKSLFIKTKRLCGVNSLKYVGPWNMSFEITTIFLPASNIIRHSCYTNIDLSYLIII